MIIAEEKDWCPAPTPSLTMMTANRSMATDVIHRRPMLFHQVSLILSDKLVVSVIPFNPTIGYESTA
jgi:hypothetical protein